MDITDTNSSVDRRTAVGALATASVGSLLHRSVVGRLLGHLRQPAKPASQHGTVVMVHGGWADGSNWQYVISPLERHGFSVLCAPIPLTTLSDDIAALERALERTTGPVILVGHAYAGAVIGAIHDDRVKSLVYIAALAPAEGETVAQVFFKDPKFPQTPKMTPDPHGFSWLPDDGVKNALAQNATPEQKRWLAAVQRPLSLKCVQENVPATAWPAKPTWFLIAEEDRMINPITQHFMAGRMNATARPLRVDHSPHVTAPDHVVDIIVAASS